MNARPHAYPSVSADAFVRLTPRLAPPVACQHEKVRLLSRDADLSRVECCDCRVTYRISHPARSLAEAELGLWKVVAK